MGTTVVILLVTHTLIIVANVGDSRIYMVRDGELERLSKDHTIVSEQVEMGMMTEEEASTSPMKHILTRNFGSSETVEPDIFELEPSNNDCFILCSDGLTDLVNDEEIGESPVTVSFEWYGDYNVRITKEGYETLKTHRELKEPWYDHFPFDFFAMLNPKRTVDSYEWTFNLAPLQQPTREEIIQNAEKLKGQL